mmetsp:Transcript_97665/g.164469  ORF Transcript_97665/g.164469 Transcript_97665/m.164469 type:complete len:92 (-) Transcript_97665:2021-2296(-)
MHVPFMSNSRPIHVQFIYGSMAGFSCDNTAMMAISATMCSLALCGAAHKGKVAQYTARTGLPTHWHLNLLSLPQQASICTHQHPVSSIQPQ